MDHTSSADDFRPYRGSWDLAGVHRYFARPPTPLSVSLQAQRVDGTVQWGEVTFMAGGGVEGAATVVSPASRPAVRG